VDPGKHNVMYDRETRAVTLVDFQAVEEVKSNELAVSLQPDFGAIFWPADLKEFSTDGYPGRLQHFAHMFITNILHLSIMGATRRRIW
jgi:hypothetical protein